MTEYKLVVVGGELFLAILTDQSGSKRLLSDYPDTQALILLESRFKRSFKVQMS